MNQEVTRAAGDRSFLLVRTGSLNCALPTSDIVRVVRGLPCHPIPGSRTHLLGLAQYGGEPLPVLDLHALLAEGSTGTRHRATVILGRGRRRDRSVVGLAVDAVSRVVELPETLVVSFDSHLVSDVLELKGEPVKILNTERLLNDEDENGNAGATDG